MVDTGSSDLWVISDSCTGNCTSSVPLYPHSTFKSANLDVQLLYGDSFTGTHAYGLIGQDTVGLGDIELQGQYFAAINNTNTTVLSTGSAGIFGLGFPINRCITSPFHEQNHALTVMSSKRYLDESVSKTIRIKPSDQKTVGCGTPTTPRSFISSNT